MYNIGSKNCCILEVLHFHPLFWGLGEAFAYYKLCVQLPLNVHPFDVSLMLLFYSVLTLFS